MLSIEDDFKKALRATKGAGKRKPKIAHTRYGYLVVRWPIVEDELAQSGGGAVMLGEAGDLTISRSSHPRSRQARDKNLERLRKDAREILGSRYEIVEKNHYLFLSPKKQ